MDSRFVRQETYMEKLLTLSCLTFYVVKVAELVKGVRRLVINCKPLTRP